MVIFISQTSNSPKHVSDKNGSTNVFFKLPGDNALDEHEDVKPIYLGFDVTLKEHSSYSHAKYYKVGKVHTPQFNNISFHVSTL